VRRPLRIWVGGAAVSAEVDDTAWLRQQMYGDEPVPADSNPIVAGTDGEHDDSAALPEPASDSGERRFDASVAVRLAAVAVVAVILTVVGAVLASGGHTGVVVPVRDSVADPAAVAPTAAAPRTSLDAADGDRPLPFTASAACPVGSTSAQTLAGADPRSAFVCVRDGVDGQVIDIDLGKTYVLAAVSITPGWVGEDASGALPWEQHRVVTRVQYLLRNGPAVTVLIQDTGNVHGEAVTPVARVLASRITMVVLQTSRPPTEPSSSPSPAPDSVFGDGSTFSTAAPGFGDSAPVDAVDATFAISNLKIIGHEAI
jgi:hypothetical protein